MTFEVSNPCVSGFGEHVLREHSPATTLTMNHDFLGFGDLQLGEALGELIMGDVHSAGDVARSIFFCAANVQDERGSALPDSLDELGARDRGALGGRLACG